MKVIKYYQKLNPKLKFIIENQKATMRLQPNMKKFYRYTVRYCSYGLKVRKLTDLFSNIKNLKLEKNKIVEEKKLITNNKDQIIHIADN